MDAPCTLVQRYVSDDVVHCRLSLLRSTGECAFVSAIERDGVTSVRTARVAAKNSDGDSTADIRLRKRIRQCRTVDDITTSITESWDARDRTFASSPSPSSFALSALRTELSAVGWHNVTAIADSADNLTLTHRDSIDSALTLDLRVGHNGAATVTRHSLPRAFVGSSGARVADVYRAFVAAAEQSMDIRRVLRDWDDHCAIIGDTHSDPLKRIVSGGDVKIAVTHSADAPYAIPDVRIIGNQNAAEPLRRKLQTLSLPQWNADTFPRINLQTQFGIVFASNTVTSAATSDPVGDNECTICFSAHSSDASYADVTCSDARCNKLFHSSCLYAWLKQLPTSTTTFNTIFGKCPHCQQTIQTSVRACS